MPPPILTMDKAAQVTAFIRAKNTKKLSHTQELRDYTLQRVLLSKVGKAPCPVTWEHQIRVSNVGVALRPDGLGTTDVLGNPGIPVKLSATLYGYTNSNEVYDLPTLAAASLEESRLVKHVEMVQSEADEGLAKDLENQLLAPMEPSGTDHRGLAGLWEHLRGTHNSSGVIVATSEPSKVGVYVVRSDAAADATYQGVSRATYARLRNMAATRPSTVFGLEEARLAARCAYKAGMKPSPVMRHGKEQKLGRATTDLVLFMSDNDYLQYTEMVALREGKRESLDLFPGDAETLAGMAIEAATRLGTDSLRPIFGVKTSLLEFQHVPGYWMKRGEKTPVPLSHNRYYIPFDHIYQLVSTNPSYLGFNLHLEAAAA
jgi:hypothetical protein